MIFEHSNVFMFKPICKSEKLTSAETIINAAARGGRKFYLKKMSKMGLLFETRDYYSLNAKAAIA